MKKTLFLFAVFGIILCGVSFSQEQVSAQVGKVNAVEPSMTEVEAPTIESTEAVAISEKEEISGEEPVESVVEVEAEEVSEEEPTSYQPCSVSSNRLREMEALYEEYDTVKSQGNQAEVTMVEKKIKELNEDIERERQSCVISEADAVIEGVIEVSPVSVTPVSSETISAPEAETASEIVDYYKSKTTSIVHEEDDIEQQVAELKELRNEIDQLIIELVQEQERIRTQEMEGVVSQIRVRKAEIELDGVSVQVQEKKTLSAAVKGNEIEVETSSEEVKIVDSGVEAVTEEIVLENETIKVNGREIKVLPAQVQEKVSGQVRSMNLKSSENETAYEVVSVEDKKILWVIPAQVEVQSKVHAENGELLSEEKPWWNFLVTE